MNLALVAIVLAIGAGAVVAVSTRETAAAAIGLAVALVASALFADPLPSASILGVRVVAALLAAALIRWAGQGATRQYSPLGWPGEALLATAGAVAGLGVAVGLAAVGIGAGGPGEDVAGDGVTSSAVTGMALLVGAGCSLLVLGVAPLVHGQLGIRRAIGLVLATQGVLLVRVGLAGQATALEEVARAVLLVTAAATGGALVRAAALERGAGNPDDAERDAEDVPAVTGGDRDATGGPRQPRRAPSSR